jgi:hypothetical protein
MDALLREVEAAIRAVTTWAELPMPESPDPTSKSFTGTANDWRILVVDFATPGGGRKQMGTASSLAKAIAMLVLPPEFAKLASEKAWPDVCPECLERGDEDVPLREECMEHKVRMRPRNQDLGRRGGHGKP